MLLTLVLFGAQPAAPRCQDILVNVRRAIDEPRIVFGARSECGDEITRAVELLAKPEQPSTEETGPQIEYGDVDGVKAVTVASGPGGSGRYWQIGLALESKQVACIETSTVGWRNLAASGIFPHFLTMARPHRLTIWESINSLPRDHDNADIPPLLLILPVVYKMGTDALVLDEQGTKDELRKWADLFRRAAGRKSAFPADLHRAAAAAYRAYADNKKCP